MQRSSSRVRLGLAAATAAKMPPAVLMSQRSLQVKQSQHDTRQHMPCEQGLHD
jgi:hypothetical protein